MVGILLIVLKVLGIILLAVISLLILLILIVLFIPIKYKAEGSKDENVIAVAGITWLLRLIKIDLVYDKDIKYRVKVLWKVVMQEGFKNEKREKSNKKSKKGKNESEIKRREDKYDNNLINNKKVKPESISYSYINKNVEQENQKEIKFINKDGKGQSDKIKGKSTDTEKSIRNKANNENPEMSEKFLKKQKEIKDKEDRIINKNKRNKQDKKNKEKKNVSRGKEIFNKIREFYNEEAYRGVIKFIWGHLIKVIKSVLPKKIEIELEYGLNDPMMTGLSLGVISIFYAILGNSMVIKPDFNQQMLKGKIYVEGRIYLFIIAYHAILVILDKRFKKLKAEYKN